MAAGLEEVKSVIERDFRINELSQRYDPKRYATVLSFSTDEGVFVVVVANEFDKDFPRGVTINLDDLSHALRGAQNKKVTVTRSGIYPH